MAVTGGIVERYGADLDPVTVKVSAAVTAGRLVAGTAAGDRRVATAGAGSLLVQGVALQSASAAEDEIAIATEGFVLLRASGAIVNGNRLEAAANGEARTAVTVDAAGSFDPRAIVAIAYETAANGEDFLAKLTL